MPSASDDIDTECRVLVVDDSAVMRRVLQESLLAAGFRVETCSDGTRACEIVQRTRPEIVISDWQMPGMNGAELCRWIRNQSYDRYTYFLIITAHEQQVIENDRKASGADAYVRKPLQLDDLVTRIRFGQRAVASRTKVHSTSNLDT